MLNRYVHAVMGSPEIRRDIMAKNPTACWNLFCSLWGVIGEDLEIKHRLIWGYVNHEDEV